jgi:hypothetical protein
MKTLPMKTMKYKYHINLMDKFQDGDSPTFLTIQIHTKDKDEPLYLIKREDELVRAIDMAESMLLDKLSCCRKLLTANYVSIAPSR